MVSSSVSAFGGFVAVPAVEVHPVAVAGSSRRDRNRVGVAEAEVDAEDHPKVVLD